MSLLSRLLPTFTNIQRIVTPLSVNTIANGLINPQVKPGGLFQLAYRNIIRVHFPRPSERKRIKRHGFKHRMSTPEGRRILMNAILKGKFVYSH